MYSDLDLTVGKVNNEIEFCTVWDEDIKKKIERAFMNNGISYCEKWDEPGLIARLFGEKGSDCKLCINSMQVEKAEEILLSLHIDRNCYEILKTKVSRSFF